MYSMQICRAPYQRLVIALRRALVMGQVLSLRLKRSNRLRRQPELHSIPTKLLPLYPALLLYIRLRPRKRMVSLQNLQLNKSPVEPCLLSAVSVWLSAISADRARKVLS